MSRIAVLASGRRRLVASAMSSQADEPVGDRAEEVAAGQDRLDATVGDDRHDQRARSTARVADQASRHTALELGPSGAADSGRRVGLRDRRAGARPLHPDVQVVDVQRLCHVPLRSTTDFVSV
jgi:hypothetical protein